MTVRLLTAGGGASWEKELVLACADLPSARVERRCYDLTDLVAAAESGIGDVVVLSSDVSRLDQDAVRRLQHGTRRVIAVLAPGDRDAQARLRALGVSEVIEADDVVIAVLHGATQHPAVISGSRVPLARSEGGHASTGEQLEYSGGRLGISDTEPECREMSGSNDLGSDDLSSGDVSSNTPGAAALDPVSRARDAAGGNDRQTEVEETSASTGEAVAARELTEPQCPGQIVAVWGPTGAPGRTTVAVNLAFELAATGRRTLLVDADTYGAAVGQVLGFLVESPGLGGVARMADQGILNAERLRATVRRAGPGGPWVLTGLTRPDLWPHVSADSWRQVLQRCAETFEMTVIDVGFCLEEGEGGGSGSRPPGSLPLALPSASSARNDVARAAVQEAHLVVAVTRADPVGLAAFLHAQRDLLALGVPLDRVALVVNRFRSTLFGATGEEQIREALSRTLGVGPWVTVPEDARAVDAALLAGRALREVRPNSASHRACVQLASLVLERLCGLAPQPVPPRRFWPSRRAIKLALPSIQSS